MSYLAPVSDASVGHRDIVLWHLCTSAAFTDPESEPETPLPSRDGGGPPSERAAVHRQETSWVTKRQGTSRIRSGDEQESVRRRAGDEQETIRRRAGGGQETIRRRAGDDQETSRRRSGDDQETSRRRAGGGQETIRRRAGDDQETSRRLRWKMRIKHRQVRAQFVVS